MRGTVKWFNAVRGYGFISPEDGSDDVFLHMTVLRQAGHEQLPPGATVECMIARGDKGMQCVSIDGVDASTASEAPQPGPQGHAGPPVRRRPQPQAMGPGGPFVKATVKWFNPTKGYGFVCLEGSDQDVFIHMVALRQAGLNSLISGQSIEVSVAEGAKGLQVAEMRANDPI